MKSLNCRNSSRQRGPQAELFQMRQDRDESFRSYAARVRGKAETCSYTTRCSCDLTLNFTDIIVKDVLIAGIADLDIRRDIDLLGIDSVLDKSLTDVITLVGSRLFTEGRSGWNTKPHRQYVKCYKERRRRLSNKPTSENSTIQLSEVDGTFAQVSTVRA